MIPHRKKKNHWYCHKLFTHYTRHIFIYSYLDEDSAVDWEVVTSNMFRVVKLPSVSMISSAK